MHRAGHCSARICYDLARWAERLWVAQCRQTYGIETCARETDREVAYYKCTALGSPDSALSLTGFKTGFTTASIVYTDIFLVVQPVVQPVVQRVASCIRGLTAATHQL